MENNNTPRKANLYYDGWKIPITVLKEDEALYRTILDPTRISPHLSDSMRKALRNSYVDVCCDSRGWGKTVAKFDAQSTYLLLAKGQRNYTLDFVESDTVPEEGEPAIKEDPDNVVPRPLDRPLNELDKQLNLMAHLHYEVKSWDISFPEDGEPHLCVTFTKVEAVPPF